MSRKGNIISADFWHERIRPLLTCQMKFCLLQNTPEVSEYECFSLKI